MEQTYRRTVEIDRDKDYWHVWLGPLNGLNRSARYPFPSEAAATRFAKRHKEIALHREVLIVYPDGRRWNGKEWAA